MTDPCEDDAPTARELRIVELQQRIEAGGTDQDLRDWQHELESISLMTDESYEEARQSRSSPVEPT